MAEGATEAELLRGLSGGGGYTPPPRYGRGYFGIGIVSGKSPENVGTLWRTAHAFGAAMIFTVAFRPPRQASDTSKAWRHVPLIAYPDITAFLDARPRECELVAVERGSGGKPLPMFAHSERAMYVLGPEDGGLDRAMLGACDRVVEIPTALCLNVATAGALVIYDRIAKDHLRRGREIHAEAMASIGLVT